MGQNQKLENQTDMAILPTIKTSKPAFKVAILGGGIGGCLTALELSEEIKTYRLDIFILEKNAKILLGSSNLTPGRIGLGFHYSDLETALTSLHASINWVKRFIKENPMLRIGEDKHEAHYLRRGRYFITKDSLFNKNHVLRIYREIKKEYSHLIDIDSNNKVFGDPENFYRILDEEEYRDCVNLDKVDVGIETAEHLLDWPKFREYIINKIYSLPNVRIFNNCEVSDFDYNYMEHRYIVLTNNKKFRIEADYIINSTWEYVDYFNKKAGFENSYSCKKDKFTCKASEKFLRTNRLKALVKVKLPEKLKSANSMFFCMGPYCMFSNMGNGIGFITYAKATNIVNSTDLLPEKKYLDYLYDKMEEKERIKLAKNIIYGVSEFIPEMKNAELIEIKFGTVQTIGEVDIFSSASDFHVRNYSGVKEQEIGFVSNACMKLLYGLRNAQQIVEIFKKHLKALFLMEKILLELQEVNIDMTSENNYDNKIGSIHRQMRKADTNGLNKRSELKMRLRALAKSQLTKKLDQVKDLF